MKDYTLNWYGKLTIENIEQVVGLFRQLLENRRYTFVAINELFRRPDVRTGQRLEPHKATSGEAFSVWFDDKNSPPAFAGFNAVDTYGVWGLSTSVNEQPYVVFEWNKVTIEHNAPAGNKLIWVLAIEQE